MTAATLCERLTGLGVVLTVRGDRLVFSAPPGVLTDELRAELQAQKQEVIAALRAQDDWDDAEIDAAIDASLERVGAVSRPHVFDGDAALADAQEAINLAASRRDRNATLEAIRTFEEYVTARYANRPRELVAELRRRGIQALVTTDEGGGPCLELRGDIDTRLRDAVEPYVHEVVELLSTHHPKSEQ